MNFKKNIFGKLQKQKKPSLCKPVTVVSTMLFLPPFPDLSCTFGWNAQYCLRLNSWTLTDTWPLIITSSEKRTLTGLDFNLAFFAALIKADLGDWKKRRWQDISHNFKLKPFFSFSVIPPVSYMLGTPCIQQHFVHRRMEIQSNHNASWGNIYVHTHKETPVHIKHTENYPTVRLERWEGLSAYTQIPVVLPQRLLSPNLACMNGHWAVTYQWPFLHRLNGKSLHNLWSTG